MYGTELNHVSYSLSSSYLTQKDVKEELPGTKAKYIEFAAVLFVIGSKNLGV
jgi:hypothetical protein